MSGNLKKRFFVYVHSRPNGVPFYVGKGDQRRISYLSKRNPYHQNIVLKYGLDNILVSRHECDSEQQAFELEKELIFILKNFLGVKLANMTDGGEGTSGFKHDPEQVKIRAIKISATLTGRKRDLRSVEKTRHGNLGKKRTPEQCARIAASNPGPKKGIFKHTEEAKAKIAAAGMGRVFSEETCQKIAQANTGKHHTAESNAKNAEKHRGIIQSTETVQKRAAKNRGQKRSPETRALMAQKAREREANKRAEKEKINGTT